jgi:hypothetical protein
MDQRNRALFNILFFAPHLGEKVDSPCQVLLFNLEACPREPLRFNRFLRICPFPHPLGNRLVSYCTFISLNS